MQIIFTTFDMVSENELYIDENYQIKKLIDLKPNREEK